MGHKENLQTPSYKKLHFEQVFSLKYCKKPQHHEFAWFHCVSKKKALGIIRAILAWPESEVATNWIQWKGKILFENDKTETCT